MVRISEHKSIKKCPYCHTTVARGQDIAECKTCNTQYHLACVEEFGFKCTVFGCSGIQQAPIVCHESQTSTLQTKELIQVFVFYASITITVACVLWTAFR